jgi:chromate transporter
MAETSLRELAVLFSRLGVTAFGGPAAHIAMMQKEVVEKRKWMTNQHFLDLIGATNLIPGPNSTEMAIHIGRERAGWKGLIVAGLCFIVPAVLITGIFAWLYKSYGYLPDVKAFIYGIKPAIIAIILAAIFPLAKKSLKNLLLGLIGIAALVFAFAGFPEIYVLFGAGIAGAALSSLKRSWIVNKNFKSILLLSLTGLPDVANTKLFFTFLKIGSILYGSGYVLFAFLEAELVQTGMLSKTELIDAIAVGQITPGPVFSSVTFVGYQINGWTGAIVSTVGIFLPAFLFVALLNPLVKKMRTSTLFASFLDAVNIASVGIIMAVCYSMGTETISDWRTILIFISAAVITFVYSNINSAWVVLGAALAGYLLSLV